MSFRTGEWVGSGYWANRASHPDFWGRPLLGRVLDPCDGRVWAHSFEFPEATPDLARVMSLVLRYQGEGRLEGKVPVEWHFKEYQRLIRWASVNELRSAKDEHVYWQALKQQRLDELKHPRRRTKRPLKEFLPKDFLHLVPA